MFVFSGPSAASARCTSARARCTAGSAAAAGPTLPRLRSADCTADWDVLTGIDQLRVRVVALLVDDADELVDRIVELPRAPAGRRAALSSRLDPALACCDTVGEPLRLRHRVARAARDLVGPGGGLPETAVERVGARWRPAFSPRFSRPVANSRRSRPRSRRFSWRPPEAIWRVRLRSTSVRSSSDAGPSTASMPGLARDLLLEPLQARAAAPPS